MQPLYLSGTHAPVNTDGCQVEDGRRAAHDVRGDPGVTQSVT